jgi:predicted methyltransferase
MHLNRPVDAMRNIYAALKPGGLMVCEEADMSAIYAEPPSGYHEYVELAFAVGATLGVEAEPVRLSAHREGESPAQPRASSRAIRRPQSGTIPTLAG